MIRRIHKARMRLHNFFFFIWALMIGSLPFTKGQAIGSDWLFDPNTIKVSEVEVHPSLNSAWIYNDNIFLQSSGDEASDNVFIVSPGLELRWTKFDHAIRHHLVSDPLFITQDYLIDLILRHHFYPAERDYAGKSRLAPKRPVMARKDFLARSLLFRAHTVSLGYNANVIQLAENSGYNALDHEASALVSMKFPSGLFFQVADEFDRTDLVNTYRRNFIYYRPNQQEIGFLQNMLNLRVGYHFVTDYMLAFDFVFLYYHPTDELAPGDMAPLEEIPVDDDLLSVEIQDISADRLDFYSFGGSVTFSVMKFEKTVLSTSYLFGATHGDLAGDFSVDYSMKPTPVDLSLDILGRLRIARDPREAVFQQVSVGAQRLLTERLKLNLGLSYQWRRYRESPLVLTLQGDLRLGGRAIPLFAYEQLYVQERKDFGHMSVDTGLIYDIPPFTTLQLAFVREPVEVRAGSGSYLINNRVEFKLARRLPRNFNVAFHVYYARNLFFTDISGVRDRDKDVWGTSARLQYRPRDWLLASLDYFHMSQLSELEDSDIDNNRVTVRLDLTF